MGEGGGMIARKGVGYGGLDGVVVRILKRKDGIGVLSEDGVEILIDVGMNTVSVKGKDLTSYVCDGDSVGKGEKVV
ncbi:PTS glucose transporter subunit IIA, partial [Paenibacillus xylanexedens]|uniref:PTS glucose transporter subunit IIA n=1 Tax=Paenibacillus xylanexedens TaxID=528191 RepID=UPI0034D976DD